MRFAMNVIDCKSISERRRHELQQYILATGKRLGLAVILVGDNPASKTYVANKNKACDAVGIYSETCYMASASSTEGVIAEVERLSNRADISGVIVQLPLPEHIDERAVVAAIPPEKDVDGLTPLNMGRLITGTNALEPCTAKGVVSILNSVGCRLKGANCVIIGRSNIVGKPLATMLTARDATVTLCHSKTQNLADITQRADIVICAVGQANFLSADMISENTIVIDVGINRDENGKIVGDVCQTVAHKCKAITPVPGGVGVMTVTSLLENIYKAFMLSNTNNTYSEVTI